MQSVVVSLIVMLLAAYDLLRISSSLTPEAQLESDSINATEMDLPENKSYLFFNFTGKEKNICNQERKSYTSAGFCLWAIKINDKKWEIQEAPTLYNMQLINSKCLAKELFTGIAVMIDNETNTHNVYYLCCVTCEALQIHPYTTLEDGILVIMSNMFIYETPITNERAYNYYSSNDSKTCADDAGFMLTPSASACMRITVKSWEDSIYVGPLIMKDVTDNKEMQNKISSTLARCRQFDDDDIKNNSSDLVIKDGWCYAKMQMEHYEETCCCYENISQCLFYYPLPQQYELNRQDWYEMRMSYGNPKYKLTTPYTPEKQNVKTSTLRSYRTFLARKRNLLVTAPEHSTTPKECVTGSIKFVQNKSFLDYEAHRPMRVDTHIGDTCINVTTILFRKIDDSSPPERATFHYLADAGAQKVLVRDVKNFPKTCTLSVTCNNHSLHSTIYCRCQHSHLCNHMNEQAANVLRSILLHSPVTKCGSFIWSFFKRDEIFAGVDVSCWLLYDWYGERKRFIFPNSTFYAVDKRLRELVNDSCVCKEMLFFRPSSCEITYQTIGRGVVCSHKSSLSPQDGECELSGYHQPLCYRGKDNLEPYNLTTPNTLCFNAILLHSNYKLQVLSGYQEDLVNYGKLHKWVTINDTAGYWLTRFASFLTYYLPESPIFLTGIFSTCLAKSNTLCNGNERIKNVLMPRFTQTLGDQFMEKLICGTDTSKPCKKMEGCFRSYSIKKPHEPAVGCLDEIPSLVKKSPELKPMLYCSKFEMRRRNIPFMCIAVIRTELAMCCCTRNCDDFKINITDIGYI